jgi:small subunit ribosomal protein S21
MASSILRIIVTSKREMGKFSSLLSLLLSFFISNTRAIFALLKNYPGGIKNMLIIDSKDCENIDKALKKYKKKFEKSKILLQLRERQSFTKPSVRRRNQVLRAIYKQNIASGKIEG